MTFIDAVGTVHQPVTALAETRIVCLVPSITELICELGLARQLVGRTGFCIHPAETVRGVPKVGGTKDVNIGKVRKLAPTHLVVNIDENNKPDVEELARFIPHVIVTHPIAPMDNLALFRLLGGIFHAGERAEALCRAFGEAYDALAATPKGPQRTVLYCIWKDPWMTISADTYIANMMSLAGWKAWTSTEKARYPAFQWSDALVNEIDEVLLSSEPYRFNEAHADALERQIGKPVQLVDGEMMSWYGSRAVAGLHYLRERLISGG
jgi:ABC-type Fe3+-hydroxamate transport system substrate-binding protein